MTFVENYKLFSVKVVEYLEIPNFFRKNTVSLITANPKPKGNHPSAFSGTPVPTKHWGNSLISGNEFNF